MVSFSFLLLIVAAAIEVVSSTTGATCGSPHGSQGPQDNPVQSLYGPTLSPSYEWTTEIQWTCVYNIIDYPAKTADDSFTAAQDDAVKNGGGIIYFPAGTYDFKSNISVASNIVIRGASTGTQQARDTTTTALNPTTIFTCPNRAHQGIWNFDPHSFNIGVVNLLLDECAVMFWPGLVSTGYGDTKTMMSMWWFSASDVAGMGRNKLVLSNLVRDVSYGDATPLSKTNVSQPYPWSFSIAIGVYADTNALIANNLLPHSQRTETTTVTLKDYDGTTKPFTVPYPYDNRYGIDLNSILLGAVASHYCSGPSSPCKDSSAFGGLYPSCAPWNFRTNLVIADNYVAQNGRVGISFTGGNNASTCVPGSGTQVHGNFVDVLPNTTAITVDGETVARGSDTNENRGYMLSGYCNNVTNNQGHIHRQQAGHSGYETVDGEGILHQSENGNWAYGDLFISNDLSGGTSGYIANWDLLWTNASTFFNNTVNPDQFIGGVLMNNDVLGSGNVCALNNPPATFTGPNKNQTWPCKPSADE